VEQVGKRLVLTAGHDRALHAVALAELLRRDGHQIAGILVVTPYSVGRLRRLARQRGPGFVLQAARRVLGRGAAEAGDPLDRFCEEHGVERRGLRSWAADHGAEYSRVRDLNAPKAVDFVRRIAPDGLIYAGGGILKAPLIEAARSRILNAHHGRTPEIRGMNACEWSLLLGVPPEVTVHVIDVGIDTGPVLERIPLEVDPGDDVEALRAKCTVLGVEGLVRNAERVDRLPASSEAVGSEGLQCYVLAPALRELLDARLAGTQRFAHAERG
jgi:methionyl-tRNA formyltransferase